VESIDVVPTMGALMGLKTEHSKGKPLSAILV
jgi:hypothetical protein